MHITFRQLRLFLALADTGSVSAAAQRLHITQPTASDQLKDITQSVGVPLYQVISKKVQLTDLGRELALTARRIEHEWENFEQRRDATRGLTYGRLRIAAVSTAKYFIPRWVGDFCKQHPAIDVSLEILNRDGVVNRLQQNMDEIYIMSMPPHHLELADEVIMDNPLVLIAAKGSALAKTLHLQLSHLKQERFILRETGSGTRMACDDFFAKHRFKPQVRLEMGSNEAIKESVAAGLGLGIVSAHSIQGLPARNGLAILAVKGMPISSQWHLVHPITRVLSPVAQAFKQELLKARRHAPR
jgi:LysR family transcriptional regulator, low CO2-responsive transcriptional regulator